MQNIQEIFKASDLDGNGLLTFNEIKTLYRLLCGQPNADQALQMQELRNLFNEYAEYHQNTESVDGLKLRAISFIKFEDLCLENDVFTIKQQNNFINQASRTFLNVSDNEEAFSAEFDRLSANIDRIYEQLMATIDNKMDSDYISDDEKLRYMDMVGQMAEAVMKAENKKIAFLTFKIVEESIKRACLKVQTELLMPL